MMDDSNQGALLSEFVDGELAPDAANRLLLEVLPNEDSRAALIQQLRLRLALAPWRQHMGVTSTDEPRRNASPPKAGWNGRLLLVAVSLSAAVFYMVRNGDPNQSVAPSPRAARMMAAITNEEAARVLQIHESITGPVAWLAVSSNTVQVRNAVGADFGKDPVVCFLYFQQKGPDTFSKTPDVVIFRPGCKAILSVPSNGDAENEMQIQLVAAYKNGKLGIWYTFRVERRQPTELHATSLTGFLPVNGATHPIGRLTFGSTTLEFSMGAEVLARKANG